MKKKTQQKVMRAAQGALEECFRMIFPTATAHEMNVARRTWKEMPQIKRIRKKLARAAEPESEQVDKALAEFAQHLALLREIIEHSAKKMTKRKRGPKTAIPKEQWTQICAQIKGLTETGRMPVRTAVEKMTELYSVNERTIYRIWRRRTELLEAGEGEN